MATPTQPSRATQVWRIARLAISAALLIWLCLGVDWPTLLQALLGASPLFVALTCCLYYIGVALSVGKWGLLLRLEGVVVGFRSLVSWYLFGAFASNFLPTDIGGDLGRGALAARATGQAGPVARSILVERVSGLCILLLFAWIGGLTLVPLQGSTRGASVVALAILPAAWLTWRWLRRTAWLQVARNALVARLPGVVAQHTATLMQAMGRYRAAPGRMAAVAGLSLVFQLLAGVGFWLNFKAVGLDLPLLPTILVMAVSVVVGMLPISINGWGVRESLLVLLLVPLGASASAVLAGSLLTRVLVFGCSLLGAALLPLGLAKKELPPRPSVDPRDASSAAPQDRSVVAPPAPGSHNGH